LNWKAYYTVHTPIEGKPALVEQYKKKISPGMRHQNSGYAAMVQSLDESVGRILEKLESLGIADNTIVILFFDNCGAHYRGITNNAPLRKGKGTLYEGGVRVPLVVRWPGITHDGDVCRKAVVSTDLYPKILDMLSLQGDPKRNTQMDGVSMVPLLKDTKAKLDRNTLYFHFPHYYYGMNTPVSSIRQGDWKLMEYLEDGHLELYNLKKDIGEKENLASKLPVKAESLRQKLHAWRQRVDASKPRQIPTGIDRGRKSAEISAFLPTLLEFLHMDPYHEDEPQVIPHCFPARALPPIIRA